MNCDEQSLIRRYGTATPEAVPQALALGPATLFWHDGALRRFAFEGIEILRGLSVVIRDAYWGTHHLDPTFSEVDKKDDTIEIRQAGQLHDEGLHLLDTTLTVAISKTRLNAALQLVVNQPFKTCRSGLVALLPLTRVAGHAATVTHVDGAQETGQLSEHISPSQPFFSIRRLKLSPTPHLDATLAFEGDTFEMEDQRNWSDASFKIYNRPLAWPAPYLLEAGACIEQRVSLTIEPHDESAPHV